MKPYAKDAGATHALRIVSLHDAQLECTCSWRLTFTGEMTKAEAIKEFQRHCYRDFAYHWQKAHSISKPPSFTSWKKDYRYA